jgi:magnesium-transporting ATPase (P-type)
VHRTLIFWHTITMVDSSCSTSHRRRLCTMALFALWPFHCTKMMMIMASFVSIVHAAVPPPLQAGGGGRGSFIVPTTSVTTSAAFAHRVKWQGRRGAHNHVSARVKAALDNPARLDSSTRATTTTTALLLAKRLRGGGGGGSSAASAVANANQDVTTTAAFSVGSKDHDHLLAYNMSNIDAGATNLTQLWTMLQSSSPDLGLTSEQVARRLQQYGRNALAQPPPRSWLALMADQFADRLVQILLAVAVLSAIFSLAEVTSGSLAQHGGSVALWKAFVEPTVIAAILMVNAVVGVWQTQCASHSLAALQQLQAATCTVVRDQGRIVGGWPADQLVPGDVVQLHAGDKVPADGRLVALASSVLSVDEGSLTGESISVSKYPSDEEGTVPMGSTIAQQRGMLFAGTMVTRGTGTMLVTHTGRDSQFGRIEQGVLSAEPPKTPLHIKLDEFGHTLSLVIGVICIAVWLVSIPKMNDPSFGSVYQGAVYYAKVAVALGVAAIPEGLPAVITLCLSLGTRRMAQRNVIVRRLPSVETLGCTSVICTDKTGTLTTNEVRTAMKCE